VRFRSAIKQLSQLSAEFPRDLDFRRKLGVAQFGLGIVHNMAGDFEEAQSCCRSAIGIQQQLVAEFPKATILRIDAAQSWTNLAQAQLNAREAASAVASAASAVELMQAAWRLENDPEPLREMLFQTYHALAQSAMQTADHKTLVRAGESHAALEPIKPRDLYDAARLTALAVTLVGRDSALAAEQKDSLADQYGQRAVGLLQRAVDLGFDDMGKLSTEGDLAALRSRNDFQELLKNL
jgi:hypothetical protein